MNYHYKLGLDVNTYHKTNIFLVFVSLLLIFESIIFYTNSFLVTDEALRSSYSFLDSEIIDRIVSSQRSNILLGYLVIPFLILLRCLLFCLPVYTVLYLRDEEKISFKKLFTIALYGEFIFIISALTKIVILTFTSKTDVIAQMNSFIPLSLKSLIDYLNISAPLFTYTFQIINLFEFAFWLLAGYSIANLLNKRSSVGFRILLMSYGIALSIWCIVVIFIQSIFN